MSLIVIWSKKLLNPWRKLQKTEIWTIPLIERLRYVQILP